MWSYLNSQTKKERTCPPLLCCVSWNAPAALAQLPDTHDTLSNIYFIFYIHTYHLYHIYILYIILIFGRKNCIALHAWLYLVCWYSCVEAVSNPIMKTSFPESYACNIMGLWAYKSCKEKWKHHITLYFIWYPALFSLSKSKMLHEITNKQKMLKDVDWLVYIKHTQHGHTCIYAHIRIHKSIRII